MRYFFVLGEHPELSLAEIKSWLKTRRLDFEIILNHKNILIIQTAAPLEAPFLMRQLGGIIKIGAIEKKLDFNNRESWAEDLANLVLSKTKTDKKINFGLSFYNLKDDYLDLGLKVKKYLVAKKRKVRFVTSRQATLSSVVVQTNKLVSESGLELVLLAKDNELWLGYTLAVQPFAELSQRDYGRPARDAASGMLPPKLAKILINLAAIGTDQTLLDPFCGSGTILTEARLMGYQNLWGSDSSDQAIKNTQKNIAWTVRETKLPLLRGEGGVRVKQGDARSLSQCWPAQSIDAIVSEPWLGPPLSGREPPAKIKNIINELSQLYLSAFKQFKKILKPGGRVVFILPAFKQNNSWQKITILDQLAALGFKQEGEPLFYARPDQRVGRQIIKFVSI